MKAAPHIEPEAPRSEPAPERDAAAQTHDSMEAALKFARDWSQHRLSSCAGGLYRVGSEKR